jgi:ribosomal protein L24E
LKTYEVGEMHITADGSELYFHSSRAGGKGQLDIWVTRNVGGAWQEPENIAIVNSADTDGWPYVSSDGNALWFTRFYQGSPAIFRSKKVDGVWAEPELIVSQFAGEPTLDDAGNLYFVHHYYKDGVMIEADIYVAYKK